MRVVATEKVDAHCHQSMIELLVFTEQRSINPYADLFSFSVAYLNDFSGEFHWGYVDTFAKGRIYIWMR